MEEMTLRACHKRVDDWLDRYSKKQHLTLSPSQAVAVKEIVGQRFSILTGGPGCGKTTTTKVIVRLLEAIDKKILLAVQDFKQKVPRRIEKGW